MREEKIIKYLAAIGKVIAPEKLTDLFDISLRTLMNDIKQININSSEYGFCIRRVRGQGYQLIVENAELFASYKRTLDTSDLFDVMDASFRINSIELILLLANDYLTIAQLAENLDVSISTVKKDLKEVDSLLSNHHLTLHSKPHYGLKVIGSELDRREAIITLIRNDNSGPKLTEDYQEFKEIFNTEALRQYLEQSLAHLNIKVSDVIFKNILQHIELLVFRLQQRNFLTENSSDIEIEKDSVYEELTNDISQYLEMKYQIILPREEKEQLSHQLKGKIISINQQQDHQDLADYILKALKDIDSRYFTSFHDDEELRNAILLHVFPLLQRLYSGHQLENPIIDDIYTKYANVFNIAYEFINSINDNFETDISKDEIGYVAIYFAASLEKQNNAELEKYKKIAVICATGGGASYFLKIKLEKIFSNAEVTTFSKNELSKINSNFDLIISTVPLEKRINNIPTIFTKSLLSEKEIKKIEKDLILLRETNQKKSDLNEEILKLFSKKRFSIIHEEDYLTILTERATLLENEGWVKVGYLKSVLEREKMIDTIYRNGLAGPHPMEPLAIIECIDVIFVRPPLSYEGKKVKLIFLINIGKGHLVLHKEISRLMIHMMEDPNLDKSIGKINDFNEFYSYLKELVMKG